LIFDRASVVELHGMSRSPHALLLAHLTVLVAGCGTPAVRSRHHPMSPRPGDAAVTAGSLGAPGARRVGVTAFSAGSWQVPDHEGAAIARTAARLGREGTVIVAGVGDDGRPDEFNRVLGEARAQSVRHELIRAGIAADRVQTVSFGSEWPGGMGPAELSSVVVSVVD
jgi:hypothetical protein